MVKDYYMNAWKHHNKTPNIVKLICTNKICGKKKTNNKCWWGYGER
jgi:hypothetical protein